MTGTETSSSGGTLADNIRRQLADDILNGVLGPEPRFDEAELAERFAVSRTPIREALRQLAATGLIHLRPRRGAIVAPIDLQAVSEAYEAAAVLEGVTAGWAAMRSTLVETEELAALAATCRGLVESGDFETYAEANRNFHNKVAEMARNAVLTSAARVVRVRIAPYQRLQFQSETERRRSSDDHDRIVEAIVHQDPEAAEREMRGHILRAGVSAVSKIKSRL